MVPGSKSKSNSFRCCNGKHQLPVQIISLPSILQVVYQLDNFSLSDQCLVNYVVSHEEIYGSDFSWDPLCSSRSPEFISHGQIYGSM